MRIAFGVDATSDDPEILGPGARLLFSGADGYDLSNTAINGIVDGGSASVEYSYSTAVG